MGGKASREEPRNVWPSAVIFMLLSILACCRGVIIDASGELYSFVGGGVFVTCIAVLCVPGGIASNSSWTYAFPFFIIAVSMLVVNIRKLRRYALLLNKEERMLRVMETLVFLIVSTSLLILILLLAFCGEDGTGPAECGVGVCLATLLRGRLALVHSRLGSLKDRIINEIARGPVRGSSQWSVSDDTTI